MAELVFGTDYLPLPARDGGIDMEYMPFGGQNRMQDTTLRSDLRGHKFKFNLRWEGLSKVERDALLLSFVAHSYAQALLVLPDGQSVTALVSTASWREGHWYDTDDVPYYAVSFTVEEV